VVLCELMDISNAIGMGVMKREGGGGRTFSPLYSESAL